MRDVDLSSDDVSRLRRAWEAHTNQRQSDDCFESPDGIGRESHLVERSSEKCVPTAASDSEVRLVFGGKDLEEGQPLRRYNITRDSTVHALGRLRGGAQLGKVVKGRSQVRKIYCNSVHVLPVLFVYSQDCFTHDPR